MKTERISGIELRLGSYEFFVALGAVASEVGRSRFYRDLVQLLARIARSDSCLVMRYARFSAPDFLVNEILTREVLDLYFAGYYRLDPFYNYWRQHGQRGVVPVEAILGHNKNENEYFNTIYHKAHISDEIAIFLPAPGGASVTLFVDRTHGHFAEFDIELLKLLYPTVAGLHKIHLDWLFLHSDNNIAGTSLREIPRAFLILDRDGRRVFVSRGWREIARHNQNLDDSVQALNDKQLNLVEFADNMIVHAEKLRSDFPVAPNGKICVIEPKDPAVIESDYTSSVDHFLAAHGLTPREGQIVKMILGGYPTEEIARKLNISRGTVKNHRGRLYYKLDITTERELFSLFLPYIFKTGRTAEPLEKRA